jgi:hypothetical protein
MEKLVGRKFGRLLVVEKIKACKETNYRTKYLCQCDCGNKILTESYKLKSSHTTSCGCYRSEMVAERNKKTNVYNLYGEYGIGYTSNTNEQFFFDLEDYDLIKDYCWRKDVDGYICATVNKQKIYFHRLILNLNKYNKIFVDHRFHNTFDNRKNNLRKCTNTQNVRNSKIQKNNTSGVTGVYWDNNHQGWHSFIHVNKEKISLGVYKDFEDAVKVRKNAEDKYFKDFSYDNSMNGGVNHG